MKLTCEQVKAMTFEEQCELLQELEGLTDHEIDILPYCEIERLIIELHCNRGRL